MTIGEGQALQDQNDVEEQVRQEERRKRGLGMKRRVGDVACAASLAIMRELVRLIWRHLMSKEAME